MNPSLYEAAATGDVGFLEGLLTADLSQKTPKENNILHIAARDEARTLCEWGILKQQSQNFCRIRSESRTRSVQWGLCCCKPSSI
ncbi:hypothetical protein ACFX2I_035780 [Malus domestica]